MTLNADVAQCCEPVCSMKSALFTMGATTQGTYVYFNKNHPSVYPLALLLSTSSLETTFQFSSAPSFQVRPVSMSSDTSYVPGRPAMKEPRVLADHGGSIRSSVQRRHNAKVRDYDATHGQEAINESQDEGESNGSSEQERRNSEEESNGSSEQERSNTTVLSGKRARRGGKGGGGGGGRPRKDVAQDDGEKGKRKRKRSTHRPSIDTNWREQLLKHSFEDHWAEINRKAGLQPQYTESSEHVYNGGRKDPTIGIVKDDQTRLLGNIYYGIEMTRFMASKLNPTRKPSNQGEPLV